MFFNLDKNTKQNLFNQYKQEAINYRQKKSNEKQRRIQEEREYLAKRELLEKEADERIYKEKLQRKNAQREEYNSMLIKTKNNIPGYRHNSNKGKEIVLNNWGGQEKSHQIQIQSNPKSPPEQNEVTKEFFPIPQGESLPWKGKKLYKNEDHLNNFLNDDRNDQELNKYINSEKEYKQKLYKDLFYSQFQEATNKNLNLFGTNDPLIVERKRKRYLSQDPFTKNNNYEFGKSNLSHNPIVDPQNNMEYNKYLKFSESQRNINNRGNYQMSNINMDYQVNPNSNNNNNYNNNLNNNNNFNNINYMNRMEDFESNNYDTSKIKVGMKLNNNYGNNLINNENYNNNNFRNEQNQNNNGYNNNSFRPTPSGERIRQAAASNFF